MTKVSVLKLDFSEFSPSLFCGPKNGNNFRQMMNVKSFDYLLINKREEQVITSSFYKGLIGKEVKELADKFGYSGKRDDSLEKIWLSMNYSILDDINKSEFQRFVSDTIN